MIPAVWKKISAYQWAAGFTVIFPLLMLVSLGWSWRERVTDFSRHHQQVAANTTELVAADIGILMEEQHRLVKVFVEDHQDLIDRLAQQPGNDALKQQLDQRLRRVFPNLFTFTIADRAGNPYLDDFDGLVGEVCVADMQEFIRMNTTRTRLHPNPHVYHFDVMAPWQGKTCSGMFLASFEPDVIARLLRAASPDAHELMLINPAQGDLMEITEQGARNVQPRDDYRLAAHETERILARVAVSGTAWQLADLHDVTLFRDYYRRQLLVYGLVMVGVLCIAITASVWLRHIEKARQAAETIKAEMFSIFSHDLRSPLIAIRGAIGLLQTDSMATEKKQHLLKLTDDNAGNMQRIVDDILDMHKLEAGKMEFAMQPVSLNATLQQAVELNHAYVAQLDVKLALVLPPQEIIIQADAQRLIQALTNLITNAAKYSPAGETVTLTLAAQAARAIIRVTDRGQGIPVEFRPYVFEKFAQSRAARSRKIGGSGLGLVIVKLIIEKHGGKVSFETETSKGTTFIVELPLPG